MCDNQFGIYMFLHYCTCMISIFHVRYQCEIIIISDGRECEMGQFHMRINEDLQYFLFLSLKDWLVYGA